MFLTQKDKNIIFGISLLVVIIIISTIVFIVFNYSRAKDLEVVSQSKQFANSLEMYFSKFNDYPVIEKVNGDSILILTENGFNEEGKVVYFKKNFKYSRPVIFVSERNGYSLGFNLNNKWPLWNLNTGKGGYCLIKEKMIMECK